MSESIMMKSENAREHMIDCQLRPNEVNDKTVIAAIRAVAREAFVPKAMRGVAYVDEDLPIGGGRCLMEPMVFARLMVAADIKSSDLVLDIGCNLGYSSAVYAQVAESVVALEQDKELASKAETALAEADVLNVAVINGPHKDGVPSQGPYDVICLQGSIDEVPEALIDQLSDGGRLVCVLNSGGVGRAHIITRRGEVVSRRTLFDANIPELVGFEKETKFVF